MSTKLNVQLSACKESASQLFTHSHKSKALKQSTGIVVQYLHMCNNWHSV